MPNHEWPSDADLTAAMERARQASERTVPVAAAFIAELSAEGPEVDPRTVPMFAGICLDSGFGIMRYDPTAPLSVQRTEYNPASLPEEACISPRVACLLKTPEFARTGTIPPPPDHIVAGKMGAGARFFYARVYRDLNLSEDPDRDVGTVLVRVDDYSVLSLGIALGGDTPGPVSFAARGVLSVREIIRRARVVFPEVFEQAAREGLAIDHLLAWDIIDLT